MEDKQMSIGTLTKLLVGAFAVKQLIGLGCAKSAKDLQTELYQIESTMAQLENQSKDDLSFWIMYDGYKVSPFAKNDMYSNKSKIQVNDNCSSDEARIKVCELADTNKDRFITQKEAFDQRKRLRERFDYKRLKK